MNNIDKEIANRILKTIILREQKNIKQKSKSDREMVKMIQTIIQDEVKSYGSKPKTQLL